MTEKKSRRKYIPFPALLTSEQHRFIAERAAHENTSKNGILRTCVDYYRFSFVNGSNHRIGQSSEVNEQPHNDPK